MNTLSLWKLLCVFGLVLSLAAVNHAEEEGEDQEDVVDIDLDLTDDEADAADDEPADGEVIEEELDAEDLTDAEAADPDTEADAEADAEEAVIEDTADAESDVSEDRKKRDIFSLFGL